MYKKRNCITVSSSNSGVGCGSIRKQTILWHNVWQVLTHITDKLSSTIWNSAWHLATRRMILTERRGATYYVTHRTRYNAKHFETLFKKLTNCITHCVTYRVIRCDTSYILRVTFRHDVRHILRHKMWHMVRRSDIQSVLLWHTVTQRHIVRLGTKRS